MAGPQLAIRTDGSNPNHHLWNNHGTWWVHFTVHLPDFTKRRVRRSLATGTLAAARRRRDHVLGQAASHGRALCNLATVEEM